MSNAFQYNDNRNGYTQPPDQQYVPQMSQLPYMYIPQGLQYFQTSSIFHPHMYQTPPAQVPTIPSQPHIHAIPPPISNTPASQASIIPVPNNSQTLPRKGLDIFDPETGQKLDFEKYTHRKKSTSEIPASSVSGATVTVKIRTPPPREVPVKIDPEPEIPENVQSAEPESRECESKPDFSLNSEEETISNKDSQESDTSKDEPLQESDASNADISPNDIDGDNQELSEDGEDNHSSDTEDQTTCVPPPSPKKIDRVGSESGNIQRYNREQLISIKSATDFATLPAPPISVVTNIGGNALRQRARVSHRPQSRRVLTFNTEGVVLDEVENAYKPSHLKKSEDVPTGRLAQLSRDLNIILNRVLEDNVSEVVDDIKNIGFKGDDEVTCLVTAITNKAARQALYSEAFAKLCKSLFDAKIEGFKERLLKASSELLSTPLKVHIDKVNANIDEKIRETNDDKVKKVLEEDRETVVTKKREAFFGFMRFFSFLFLHELISSKSFIDTLRPFSKPKSQDDVLALLTCLNICGEKMEKGGVTILKTCIVGLENARKSLKLEQHVQYKIISLVELRQRNWKTVETPIPPQNPILPRSNSSKDSLMRRAQVPNVPRKASTVKPNTGDSKTQIDAKNLTIFGSSSRSSYLGPPNDWSKGSKAQTRRPKSGLSNELETGKDSRSSSVSIKKEDTQISQLKIDENLTAKAARIDAIDAFANSDTPQFDLLLRESRKEEFVRELLYKAIESRSEERRRTVHILSHLYSKRQLNDKQMAAGFSDLIEFSDEIDCPKLGEYFGELISSMVVGSPVDLTKIVELIDMLREERDKREALAQCINFSAKRVGETEVAAGANKILTRGLPWGNEKIFKDSGFLKRYQIEFINLSAPSTTASYVNSAKQWRETTPSVSSSTEDQSTGDLIDKCLQRMDVKELTSICSQNLKTKDAEKYLRKILSHCGDLERKEVDSLVPVVKTLVQPPLDSSKFIYILQASVSKEGFKTWLQALLQQKLLTPQSVQKFAEDKRALSAYKELAAQILRKCRQ